MGAGCILSEEAGLGPVDRWGLSLKVESDVIIFVFQNRLLQAAVQRITERWEGVFAI